MAECSDDASSAPSLSSNNGVKAPPKSAFSTSECTPMEELVGMCFPCSGSNCGSSLPPTSFCASPAPYSASSRQGRDNQRWEKCSKTGVLVRLTTGSVPITKDGSILFVSSAKKREWILPKGGWELDETLQEGAKRETFEEAGLVGTLGPPLAEVVYETRKGRARRHSPSTTQPSENSEAQQASVNRMALFPLYVTQVHQDWPESGRTRKVFAIDEAIQYTQRPEIKLVLEEIKSKGLHLPTNMR
mmetsp:Transcript_10682/g.15627  ORF Transcript_10682/g.15627 Transcript_10682/m.15627 type:complete len:245 (+) Transcript_10682:330-1064(+)|eukprot:CAMPEP_0195527188 /NCGR_PEP_ID=MMETSP0794_2-20130614/28702_1 /TAXON_ID=515487 /ORGANISM="Stephanopyxis turris, Strain CCMP 815" /LENGTH=244 /DNA_ID=CAMNT_0040658047 /DNA_START=327 /DNA_END=1061 /DNA_ORIENTATION=+